MANMKILYQEEIKKALNTIYNGMDGEAEVWLCEEVGNAWNLIHEAMQKLAIIDAVYEECEKDYSEDLYEICSEHDEEFEDLLADLQKVNEVLD
jgi:hypothetical protein